MKIRKGDYLQSTASELNGSLERLHDEVAALRQIARDGAAAEPEDARQALEQLTLRLDAFTLLSCAPECRVLEDAPAAPIARAAPVAPVAEPLEAEAVAS